MKAMRISQYGDPVVRQLQDIPQPKPGAGEALVRWHAAGVNYADLYFRNGAARIPVPFPYTLGLEGKGLRKGWLNRPSIRSRLRKRHRPISWSKAATRRGSEFLLFD
jgi:hypothetical protein